MKKYVAFLRGINVGGRNKIKMESLRNVFRSLGFEDVKSYINSGNVVFTTREADTRKLALSIAEVIVSEFSLSIFVMVRSIREIEEIIKNNPFKGKFEDKTLHIFFLDESLPEDKEIALLSNNSEDERFAVEDREIYCLMRVRFSDSLMGKNYISNKLKVSATARNWRTVNKVLEL